MDEDILGYYNAELDYLREAGVEFAERHKDLAAALRLGQGRPADPHVERLLQGFAFLTARIQQRLDADFPEVVHGLLSILYPHYLRPIPSLAVVELSLRPQGAGLSTKGLEVPRGSRMSLRTAEKYNCNFETRFDTTVWPLTIVKIDWAFSEQLAASDGRARFAHAAITVEIQTDGGLAFGELGDSDPVLVRFFLDAHERPNVALELYELLFRAVRHVEISAVDDISQPGESKRRKVSLPLGALRPVGFADRDDLWPYPGRSFKGYRLLQEYFSFPEKFLFFDLDLSAFRDVCRDRPCRKFEIEFVLGQVELSTRLSRYEPGLLKGILKLNCLPIANLYSCPAQPILLDHSRHEYPVFLPARCQQWAEVFSVDRVVLREAETSREVECSPLYGAKVGPFGEDEQSKIFWHMSRSGSGRGQPCMYMSFADCSGRPLNLGPAFDSVSIWCTCTDGDLPSVQRRPELTLADFRDFGSVRTVVPPTRSLRPSGRQRLLRLLSNCSLNYLAVGGASDTDRPEERAKRLKEVLSVYDYSGSGRNEGELTSAEKQIQGVADVVSRAIVAQLPGSPVPTFVRGMEVELTLAEDTSAYLFASVFEQFLALSVSINSFVKLVAKTSENRLLGEWTPRTGTISLL